MADISPCLDQKKFDFIVKVVGENITNIPGVTEKLHVRNAEKILFFGLRSILKVTQRRLQWPLLVGNHKNYASSRKKLFYSFAQ